MTDPDAYTPEERRWLSDPHDPRPDCPNRDQHAHRMYGDRWSREWSNRYPTIDGKSVAKTYRQVICEGCARYMIWLPRKAARPAENEPGPV